MFHQPSGADMVGKQDGEVHPWLLREKACPFAIVAANGCSGGLISGSIRAKSSASPVRAAAEKPRLRAFLPVMPNQIGRASCRERGKESIGGGSIRVSDK